MIPNTVVRSSALKYMGSIHNTNPLASSMKSLYINSYLHWWTSSIYEIFIYIGIQSILTPSKKSDYHCNCWRKTGILFPADVEVVEQPESTSEEQMTELVALLAEFAIPDIMDARQFVERGW